MLQIQTGFSFKNSFAEGQTGFCFLFPIIMLIVNDLLKVNEKLRRKLDFEWSCHLEEKFDISSFPGHGGPA